MQEALDQAPVSEPLAVETSRRTFLKNFSLGVLAVTAGLTIGADLLSPSEAQGKDKDNVSQPNPDTLHQATIDNTEAQAEKSEADAQSSLAGAAKTRADARNDAADAAKTRADAASSRADAAKTQAEAASARADIIKTKADAKEEGSIWQHIGDIAPTVVPLGLFATAGLTYLQANKARQDANKKILEDKKAADKQAREDKRNTIRQADDTAFTSIQLRLEGTEDTWHGADIELLAFSQGSKKEYADYTDRIFDLTRTVLRVRAIDAAKAITPNERNVVSSFLAVLEPARQKERAARKERAKHRHQDSNSPELNLPLLEASAVNMDDTNLMGEDLSEIDFTEAMFAKANIEGAYFNKSRFMNVDFGGIGSAKGAVFIDCELTPAQKTDLIAKGAPDTIS